MARREVRELLEQLHAVQCGATERIRRAARDQPLEAVFPNGLTALENLRTWGWHFWTHTRDLVRLRGSLPEDLVLFDVDHLVRQAHEEFGRFAGEVACLSDEDLDRRAPQGGASIRETVEHVIRDLESYLPEQFENVTQQPGEGERTCRQR